MVQKYGQGVHPAVTAMTGNPEDLFSNQQGLGLGNGEIFSPPAGFVEAEKAKKANEPKQKTHQTV